MDHHDDPFGDVLVLLSWASIFDVKRPHWHQPRRVRHRRNSSPAVAALRLSVKLSVTVISSLGIPKKGSRLSS